MSPTEGGSLLFFILEAFRDDVDGPAAIPSADEACVAERSTANATLSDDVLLIVISAALFLPTMSHGPGRLYEYVFWYAVVSRQKVCDVRCSNCVG